MKLISRYRDRIVVKIDWFDNLFFHRRPQAASFIFLFIDSREPDMENILRHEYGHSVQLRMLGLFRYIRYIARPSVRGYRRPMTVREYYSQPWEYIADLFGGAIRRSYLPDANSAAWNYWIPLKKKKRYRK